MFGLPKRVLIRFVSGMFAIAAIILIWQYVRYIGKDITDLGGKVDSEGQIVAIEYMGDGARAVLIGKDGKAIPNPGWHDGVTDRDAVWRPDGNRIFFSSDRNDETFNIFRWNIATQAVEQKTLDSRSKGAIQFDTWSGQQGNAPALITVGGKITEFDARELASHQLLPPVPKELPGGGGEGAMSQMEAVYRNIGDSFRLAKWGKGGTSIIAVMRRDASETRSAGEILISQSLIDGKPPKVISAGRRIDFDVDTATGAIVFTVHGFQWPDNTQVPAEFIKNGRVTVPFENIFGVVNIETDPMPKPFLTSNGDKGLFRDPVISADGKWVAVVTGSYDDKGQWVPEALCSFDMSAAQPQLLRLTTGEIYEPSWHPNNIQITFAKREPGKKRSIFVINKDGSGERNLTENQGDFAYPHFSPQTTKSGN